MYSMKYITRVLALFVFTASCALVVHASGINRTYTLYTLPGFVDALITRGIVPPAAAGKARELARMITRSEQGATTHKGALNADKVTVTVSKLIEQANLEYDARVDIKGPILIVKNISSEATTLEAKRRCQIVYRVYDTDDVMVYDSATTEACMTNEKVTYPLAAGQVRMFPILHQPSNYPLKAGTYRLELEYPGYGTDDLTITVK